MPGGALESMVQMAAPAVKICDKPVKVSSSPSTMVVTQPPEGQDGPPSPLSEASSGYFSHSVSTATLSETFTLGLDTTGPGNQTPGSPPALSQVTPEPELAFLSCSKSHPPAPEEPQVLPATPSQSIELEVPRPPLLSEPTSTVPTSPFRIRTLSWERKRYVDIRNCALYFKFSSFPALAIEQTLQTSGRASNHSPQSAT